MKHMMIILGLCTLLLASGCSKNLEAEKTYQSYLSAFKSGNYDGMWQLLSKKQQANIAKQLENWKAHKANKIKTEGLISMNDQKLSTLTPQEYYKEVLTSYQKILHSNPRAKQIFDLSIAHVQKVETFNKVVIVKIFDGAKTRQVQMVKENDQWKVGEEYSLMEKKNIK